MTEVLRSPSHFASSPPRNSYPSSSSPSSSSSSLPAFTNLPDVVGGEDLNVSDCDTEEEDGVDGDKNKRQRRRSDQLSLLALLVTLFRKSLVSSCSSDRRELCSMEIGWPTNVRHVAHVTFDRFNGFLGLPVEFEPEVPRRVPSASTTVFGVSTESMQLSYDSRGNSVPTILLLMQQCLYGQGGLQAEGIFRINAENSQEEYVRDQLNTGVVPEGVDVHCLAGLIKTWFRELPTGILDSLSPEQVMQCETEEEYLVLVRLLPQTEAALLDWAINLMADVVQNEHFNKMNERNIAMVFAPNMTQMADPLIALMYAVQVMNFLKTLILRTLRERVDLVVNPALPYSEPSDKNGHPSPSDPHLKNVAQGDNEEGDDEPEFTIQGQLVFEEEAYSTSLRNEDDSSGETSDLESDDDDELDGGYDAEDGKSDKSSRSSKADIKKGLCEKPSLQVFGPWEVGPIERGNSKGISSNLSRIDSRNERIEAWR